MTGLFGSAQRLGRLFARMQFDGRKRKRFYRNVVALMRSGMSRSEAIETICSIASQGGEKSGEPMALIAFDVSRGIRNGLGFADALSAWIPKDEYGFLAVIENTHQFQEQLDRFCTALDKREGQRHSVASALAYPVFLLLLSYGLLVYFDIAIVSALDRLLPAARWTGVASALDSASGTASDLAPYVAAVAIAFPALMLFVLPRWTGRGRTQADKLPFFAAYRIHAGAAFLQSVASLMASGMSAVEAINRVKASTRPYVAGRAEKIRFHLLNGCDLGTAMDMADTGWPDPELNVSLKICSRSPNFPSLISLMVDEWRANARADFERQLAIMRSLAFVLVFGVILFVVFAMYEIQGQIAAGF